MSFVSVGIDDLMPLGVGSAVAARDIEIENEGGKSFGINHAGPNVKNIFIVHISLALDGWIYLRVIK
jgi:hypothetical protein